MAAAPLSLEFGFAATNDSQSAILFGRDPTERIVAVEPGESSTSIWRRLESGKVERIQEPFRPWLLLTEPDSQLRAEARELTGDGYRFLYEFDSWNAYLDEAGRLKSRHAEILTYGNGSKLALIRSGKTLFKGMTMAEVVRMQIDLETTTLAPQAHDGQILIIAIRDNRGLTEVLTGDEPEMLNRLIELIRERDPDIIEGHNLYGFDFPYLFARARRHRIKLAFGRDGSEPRVGKPRNFAIGGITRPFAPVWIYGRQIYDTYLAVQRFDWANGMLTSYALKEVARTFGISEPDRIEIPRHQIAQVFHSDPERVREYARQDVVETGRLAELIEPTEFYMSQMVPDSFGSAAVSGVGEKINSILIRAYLAAGHAIPKAERPRPYPGGYTDIRATGVIDRVVKADVESLYPSIMLAEKIKPANDVLDVFLPALAELARRRLDAKKRMSDSEGVERRYWDGLQGSFKILINSFYGYLGAAGCHFNDCEAAGRVTQMGRKLVKEIADRLESTGSRVIEIDTDGVYFTPPDSVDGEDAERAYVAEIGSSLPAGIRLAFDGRYQAMISLKTKNYVVCGYDGKKIFRGASLRSRADERMGREFIASAVDLLFERKLDQIRDLYRQAIDDLINRRIPIEKLARRERVTEKTFTSSNKLRSARVAKDLGIGEFVTVYERANGELGLLEEYEQNGRDERIEYYTDKLYKFACRLQEAFGRDFDRCIPRPTPGGLPDAFQHSLDLFDDW